MRGPGPCGGVYIDAAQGSQLVYVAHDRGCFVAHGRCHEVPVHQIEIRFRVRLCMHGSARCLADDALKRERSVDDPVAFRPLTEAPPAEDGAAIIGREGRSGRGE